MREGLAKGVAVGFEPLHIGGVPPNKGMKQTSVEHIGRSQLIPGVGRTVARATRPTVRMSL